MNIYIENCKIATDSIIIKIAYYDGLKSINISLIWLFFLFNVETNIFDNEFSELFSFIVFSGCFIH